MYHYPLFIYQRWVKNFRFTIKKFSTYQPTVLQDVRIPDILKQVEVNLKLVPNVPQVLLQLVAKLPSVELDVELGQIPFETISVDINAIEIEPLILRVNITNFIPIKKIFINIFVGTILIVISNAFQVKFPSFGFHWNSLDHCWYCESIVQHCNHSQCTDWISNIWEHLTRHWSHQSHYGWCSGSSGVWIVCVHCWWLDTGLLWLCLIISFICST